MASGERRRYQLVVVGGGPGGYVAAHQAAKNGLTVACVDKQAWGGTCLNVGCIPSKTLLHTSELYALLQDGLSTQGLACQGAAFDFAALMARKQSIVEGLVANVESLLRHSGVTLYRAEAAFADAHTLRLDGRDVPEQIESEHILLATGSQPVELPFAPFDERRIVSSTGALALPQVPRRLVVVGAGVIGVELASVYRRLGSEVQLVEMLGHICPGVDKGAARTLLGSLKRQGLTFHLETKLTAVEAGGDEVVLTIQKGDGPPQRLACDVVLVCVGRRPNSRALLLDKAGLEAQANGSLAVDSCFRSAVPHIFAIGDLIDGPGLAHKASQEGIAVADLLAGKHSPVDYMTIPNVVYTHPEVASVGMTEEEAAAWGFEVAKGVSYFKGNARARCSALEEGWVKVLGDKHSGKVLGVHIVGAHASEMIGEGALALALRATVQQLALLPHAHPTLSETIKEAAMAAL